MVLMRTHTLLRRRFVLCAAVPLMGCETRPSFTVLDTSDQLPATGLDLVLVTDMNPKLQNSHLLLGELKDVTLGSLFTKLGSEILRRNGLQGNALRTESPPTPTQHQLQLMPVGCSVECDFPNFRRVDASLYSPTGKMIYRWQMRVRSFQTTGSSANIQDYERNITNTVSDAIRDLQALKLVSLPKKVPGEIK